MFSSVEEAASPELSAALAKVAVFALVQALVYLILRNSSDVFTPGRTAAAGRFRPMRSMSVRRVLSSFSDVPVGIPEDGASPSPVSPAGVVLAAPSAAGLGESCSTVPRCSVKRIEV